MGVAAMGLVAGGGLVSAFGNIQAGKAAKARGDFQAQVLRANAAFREEQADDAIDRGKVLVQRTQTAFAQFMGTQRATLAANGILVDDGSALTLVSQSAGIGRQEELDIELNAEREAMALLMDASSLTNQATLAKAAGKDKKQASQLAAVGSLLGAGGSVASIASQQ